MRRFICSCVLTLVCICTQGQVKFSCHTPLKNVAAGQVFELMYSLEGGKMQDFRPPNFGPFKVVGGPSRSSQTTIINGHMTSNVSYGYSLLAQKEGQYILSPGKAKVGGIWHKSNALTITVKKPTDISRPKDLVETNDVFITLNVSTDTAYVGQQVVVDYVLYSNVQTRGADLLSEPDFENFYVQYPRLFPRHPKKLTINNQMYESKVIRRISLFPQFPGTYTLEQINARVRILLEGNKRGVFSFFERTEPVIIQSPRDTLVVYSVPDTIPSGFTGAVGDFTIKPSINKKRVGQDQAVTLRLHIRGNGDSKKIIAPALDLGENFTLYDSKLIKEEMTEIQGEIISQKVFDYVIVPNKMGTYQLPLHFSYFNPNVADYVQSEFLPLTLEVFEGRVKEEGESVLFDDNLHKADEGKKISPWLIPSTGTAILIAALAYLFLRRKNDEEGDISEEVNWDERARQYLIVAHEKIHDTDGTQFYESIRQGVYGYVAQKLGIPLSELTKEKVYTALDDAGLKAELLAKLKSTISASEMALFAGVDNLSMRAEVYDQSVEVLSEFEKYFGREN